MNNNISREILEQYKDYLNKREKIKALADRPGTKHEGEVAKNLLEKLDSKIQTMEKEYGLSHECNSSTDTFDIRNQKTSRSTTFDNNQRYGYKRYATQDKVSNMGKIVETESEESLLKKLGIIYVIFGTQYTVHWANHEYIIYFKRQAKDEDYAFYRVYSDIYEDGQNICEEVVIGFCPYYAGDTECGDMEISTYDNGMIKKYRDSCKRYKEILEFLKIRWNEYFSSKTELLSYHNQQRLDRNDINKSEKPKSLTKNIILW